VLSLWSTNKSSFKSHFRQFLMFAPLLIRAISFKTILHQLNIDISAIIV
jgi:hypothetical protein